MVRGGSVKSDYAPSSYREPFHEKPFFHYLLLILVLAALAISILALYNTSVLTKPLAQRTVDVNDFLAKLTAHAEMGAYVGVAPLNIIRVNNSNLANLQTQINGLDNSFIGSFIVQYTDAIIVYDYANDQIRGTVNLQQAQQAALPADFLTKLNQHPELQGLEAEQPVGGQIDAASLATLKQQFPDVYANAKVGDFLLRYQTRLIIYDYNNDIIVNAVNLG